MVITFTFIGFFVLYVNGGGWGLLSTNICGEDPSRGQLGPNIVIFFIILSSVAGVFSVSMLITALDIFQKHLDFENEVTKYLSNISYTVLLHYIYIYIYIYIYNC